MSGDQRHFVDEFFNVHVPDVELGRGGQGVVFRTCDPDVAVKLVLDGSGEPVTRAGDYVERLRLVRALPLPRGLNLSAPMAVLQGTAGYAMRLLDDMVPFASFWPAPRKLSDVPMDLPGWLAAMPPDLAHQLLWYRDTGGLQRRLVALYKCAAVLARLHAAGLVYGDVSPNNAFVSEAPGSREVWLIDADNLRYELPHRGHAVFTPRFGAPELVRGEDGGRPRTDCHAFAVMAFWMLTLLHPFIGGWVEEGGGGDWAGDGDSGDPDELAFAGHVPWILDEDDDRNRKDNGLIDLVVTRELMTVFQATFGPGRTRPWRRPSMFHWPKALAQAADQAISCSGCGMGYYVDPGDAGQRCPFCDAPRPRTLVTTAYDWTGRPLEGEAPAWRAARALTPASASPALPHRLFQNFSLLDGDRDALEVIDEGDALRLRCGDLGGKIPLALACADVRSGAFLEFEGAAMVSIPAALAGFFIRAGGPSPRVVRVALTGERAR